MTEALKGYAPPAAVASTDVTWLRAGDAVLLSLMVSRLVYPSPDVFWRPGAVILVSDRDPLNALAGVALVHFPNNAPVLLTDPGSLSPAVAEEIARLAPTGKGPRGKGLPAHVYLVGNLSDAIEDAVEAMGLRALQVGTNNPAVTAATVARLRAAITGKRARDAMIAPDHGELNWTHAVAMSAHHGTPLLYVSRDEVPRATEAYLRGVPAADLYIVGNPDLVGAKIVERLKALTSGKVERLGGQGPAADSVQFARFHQGDFGWGRTKRDGDAFTFVAAGQWQAAAAGALLAHLGKHTPILLLEGASVPDVVADYLASVNPKQTDPPKPPFMHGFILDFQDVLAPKVHVQLEGKLIQACCDWPPPPPMHGR